LVSNKKYESPSVKDQIKKKISEIATKEREILKLKKLLENDQIKQN
jgi:hypothetical protein